MCVWNVTCVFICVCPCVHLFISVLASKPLATSTAWHTVVTILASTPWAFGSVDIA